MSQKLLLVDSDLFVLLAACGRLERIAGLLGFDLRDVRRLDPLPRQLTRGRAFRRKYPEPVRNPAVAECGRVAAVSERPHDDALLQRLIQVNEIDDGEALLYALAAENQAYLLASGDKRAMTALAGAADFADIRSAVAGRVVALETALELLVRHDDLDELAAALAPLRDVNQTIKALFGSEGPYDRDDRLRAIASYRNDLAARVGEDFLYSP